MELVQTEAGMVLEPSVTLGGDRFTLAPEKTAVVGEDPLWLLSKTTLYPVQDGAGLVTILLDHPELTVPADETQAFFDTFLLPLAEQVSVVGEGSPGKTGRMPSRCRACISVRIKTRWSCICASATATWKSPMTAAPARAC